MIEMTLEEDLPEEFRGGTLRIGAENKLNESSKATSPNILTPADKTDKESAELSSNNNNCHWRNAFIAPFSSIPNKITETIWSSKSKETTPAPNTIDRSVLPSIPINEDPNNFFTFRDGVMERAVRECINQFLDPTTEGPLYASFLLTQINHWDIDKERLILVTAKSMVLVKYDFIALKRLDYQKISLNDIEGIIIGNLVYPSGSLIPERNMKGIRLLLKQEKSDNLASKWNPFNNEVPFWTFTFHPLYFHKDCTDEKFRSLYNLELFIEQLCTAVNKIKENSVILHHNILLENYIGLGSIIHNRNSLGFFKVRGKFSF
ncbi:tumor protein p63-regulated gene 1-like protein isoform X2 [Anoplophora glabripennis]|uniref:tumor protein p63-regulated gene 1-like protein isoform X2 n=1 Tax=Anoplophora glabripennis TaxID=217634 RepID=UPI0008736F7B|nr:tumor protein p63-regulated gene 1-like protein isoform X2 [Anoplophora glabripennis]